ncbi:hypothetical protein [Pantoea agglomerans]|uniref:hypothetical protein n=1 Tax=Enterobacter agglomerans TaxID=549 RepID=UPI0013BAB50C|nr:hypothetical protein [Pantoea agglomerans]NEG58170.1 hypothetical protein [Pantoea agglomerans]NEG99883.1 hypothetical protein [Pantoea agglomerans]NEH04154.1 hypothetical protein [Pantoea agglomerans]NEH14443.1 hypothetical protein [Pantoea agglomerans]
MDRRLLTEKIQREILTALAIAYPDPLTGRQYFAAFGRYSESVMLENIEALIKRGLIRKTAIRSCGDVSFLLLAELILSIVEFIHSGARGHLT